MKRTSTSVILLLISCFSFGQNLTTKHLKPISIGLNFSPDITNRRVPDFPDRDKDETSKFGYTTGLNFYLPLNNKLQFETGIHYSNKGYRTIKKGLVGERLDPAIPTNATFVYSYKYVDVPAKLSMVFGKKKLRFISGLGVITNFLIEETIKRTFEFPGETTTTVEPSAYDNNKINLSPVLSAGVDYKLSNNSNLRAEPTFRYGLWQPYLLSAGMNLAYYRNL